MIYPPYIQYRWEYFSLILLFPFIFFPHLHLSSGNIGEEGKKKKKSVSWAEEDNLVNIHYFEMDESERGKTMCIAIHVLYLCVDMVCVWKRAGLKKCSIKPLFISFSIFTPTPGPRVCVPACNHPQH